MLTLAASAHASEACLGDEAPCTDSSECCGECFQYECLAPAAPPWWGSDPATFRRMLSVDGLPRQTRVALQKLPDPDCPALCRSMEEAEDEEAYLEGLDDPACADLHEQCSEDADCCRGMLCESRTCEVPRTAKGKKSGGVLDPQGPPSPPRPCQGKRTKGQRCINKRGMRRPCKAGLRCAYWRNRHGKRVPICRQGHVIKAIYNCASLRCYYQSCRLCAVSAIRNALCRVHG